MQKHQHQQEPHDHEGINESPFWDRVGMTLSSICAVHCLLAPLIPFALPWLAMSFHHPLFHVMIALFVVPVGIWAFWNGYKKHHVKWVFGLGTLGVLMVTTAAIIPHQLLHFFGHDGVSIAASLVLIAAHGFNRRYTLRVCCKH